MLGVAIGVDTNVAVTVAEGALVDGAAAVAVAGAVGRAMVPVTDDAVVVDDTGAEGAVRDPPQAASKLAAATAAVPRKRRRVSVACD